MAKNADRGKVPRRVVRDDEVQLFEAAMREVKPLVTQGGGASDRTGAKAVPNVKRPDPDVPPISMRKTPLPELRPGRATDLDFRTMERLRRGRIRPEAQLDLHGMTQDEAHRAVAGFIAASRSDGRRCVLLITGRGRGKFGGGVLREQTPRWLNLQPTRGNILGFAESQPKDGGAGALYVLLKKYS